MEDGPPMFRQDFTCPALLKSFSIIFTYGAVTRYGHTFQSVLLIEEKALAWSRFARHYYGNLGLCLFLQVLRCFSSLGLLHQSYIFTKVIPYPPLSDHPKIIRKKW